MSLLDRLREAVFRLIMISALAKNRSSPEPPSSDHYYYPNDHHHSEAIADCIQFIKKSTTTADDDDETRNSAAAFPLPVIIGSTPIGNNDGVKALLVSARRSCTYISIERSHYKRMKKEVSDGESSSSGVQNFEFDKEYHRSDGDEDSEITENQEEGGASNHQPAQDTNSQQSSEQQTDASQRDTNERLKEISTRIGYEFDLSTERTEVFDQLKGIPGPTLKHQFYISKKLVKEPEPMDLFRGLPEVSRPAFVLDLLKIDGMI
ncbi:hypothetical protein SASPL_141288 [Salvia splendens]|uniref:Uncharacterized protein n=1 Tax=Salvia splendens TaxID=180675 RepID=A0A8X8WRC8_SALSN|nr:hypothetical protein SASPL_141288 [Salvia splendens]